MKYEVGCVAARVGSTMYDVGCMRYVKLLTSNIHLSESRYIKHQTSNFIIHLLLHIWISAEDGRSETLCLIAKSVEVCILFTIAKYYTQTAAEVCIRLSEDTHASTFFVEAVIEVVVDFACAMIVLISQNNSRASCMLKTDVMDWQSHNGTEMEFEF